MTDALAREPPSTVDGLSEGQSDKQREIQHECHRLSPSLVTMAVWSIRSQEPESRKRCESATRTRSSSMPPGLDGQAVWRDNTVRDQMIRGYWAKLWQ
jgi:hypothetical protein